MSTTGIVLLSIVSFIVGLLFGMMITFVIHWIVIL